MEQNIESTIFIKLLEAQKEIGAIKRDNENSFFKGHKYFDINAILREVKPILNKHGLVLIQALDIIGDKNGLSTVLIDSTSGEKIQSGILLPTFAKPQEMGSAITYFRRYAIQSLLALEAEDDDGNVASGSVKKVDNKNDNKFMQDLEPTDEEVIGWQEKLESATTLKELKTFWKITPPMIQDKLSKLKDELKNKLG